MAITVVNVTFAKDVALHFVDKTGIRVTKTTMGRTINNVKTLMQAGYTKEELINAIDFLVDVKKVDMYSFGYISVSIEKTLHEMKAYEVRMLQRNHFASMKKPEVSDDEATERNRSKAERFGNIQSGFGTQSFDDLFE